MLLLSNKFYPSYFCQGKEWQLFQFMQGHYVEDCLASYDVSCDRIIGEACEYLGKLVFEAPPGAIVDPTHCEQLCMANDFLGCVYYYYEMDGRKCYLYDSDERTCHAVGGPQKPFINECRGM